MAQKKKQEYAESSKAKCNTTRNILGMIASSFHRDQHVLADDEHITSSASGLRDTYLSDMRFLRNMSHYSCLGPGASIIVLFTCSARGHAAKPEATWVWCFAPTHSLYRVQGFAPTHYF